MTPLAPHMEAFFREHSCPPSRCQPPHLRHTPTASSLCSSSRPRSSEWRPSALMLEQLDASLIQLILGNIWRPHVATPRRHEHPFGCHPLVLPVFAAP